MNKLPPTIVVALLLVFTMSSDAFGQPPRSQFGTCSWWQYWRTEANNPVLKQLATVGRTGVAQGFVLGIFANLYVHLRPAESTWVPSPEESKVLSLKPMFEKGFLEVWVKPVILVDGFDAKCGDYKNSSIDLSSLGLIVILEIGGVAVDRVEEALRILRSRGREAEGRLEVLRALSR